MPSFFISQELLYGFIEFKRNSIELEQVSKYLGVTVDPGVTIVTADVKGQAKEKKIFENLHYLAFYGQ